MIKKAIRYGWGAVLGLGRLFPAWFTNPGLLGTVGQDVGLGQAGHDSEKAFDMLLGEGMSAPKRRVAKIVNLHLSPSFFLKIELLFPKKALGEVAQAMALHIRQNTPFSESEIVWRYKVQKRDATTVLVMLYILKKPVLESVCGMFESMGARVRMVHLQNTGLMFFDNTPAIIPAQKFWQRITKAALVLAAIAALSASYFNYQKRAEVLARIKAENIALQEKALALREARTAQETEATRIASFLSRLQKDREVLALITSLSNLLPDSTWLAQLTLRRSDIRLAGFSTDDPSNLIIKLEESPYFRQVVLTGPITREPRLGQNRFEMALALEAPDE